MRVIMLSIVPNSWLLFNMSCAYADCAFRSKNTLARLVKTTNNTRTPPHTKPGIYQLTCNTCNLSYIGQTSHNLKTCYHEHIRYIRKNNPQSAYAEHILNKRHKFVTIDNIMTLIKHLQSQHLLTAYEQFYIHSFHKNGKLISEPSPGSPNPRFDITTQPSRPAVIVSVVLRTPQCLHTEPHITNTHSPLTLDLSQT